MSDARHFPPKDEVIKLLSLIVIIIMISGLFDVPERFFEYQLPGLYINFTLNQTLLVALFVTGIISSGLMTILRHHPRSSDQPFVVHWFLAILIAITIVILLEQTREGIYRYLFIVLGMTFLAIVIVAEYITLDSSDRYFLPAAVTIQAVSNGAFVMVTAALQNAETRLFYILPVIILSHLAFSYRILTLRISPQKALFPAILFSVIIGEVAAAIHYFAIRPIQYGLMLVGVSYCLLLFINPLLSKEKSIFRYLEGLVFLVIIWGIAIFFV